MSLAQFLPRVLGWGDYNILCAMDVITVRKRSLRRLCFYRGLSVHRGGMRGRGCAWWGGHAWWGVCEVGGVHGGGGRVAGGHAWWGCAWQGGMCGMHTPPWTDTTATVNDRAVCILLECILVTLSFYYRNEHMVDVLRTLWEFLTEVLI